MTVRPAFKPETLSRRDASGQIATQLRAAINEGTWRPGERLPSEQDFAETFEVSRATAREALKLLAATGLVESVRGGQGGTFVTVPSANKVAAQLGDAIRLWYRTGNVTLQQVREARQELETISVAYAAEHRTDEDIRAIQATIDTAREPGVSAQEWFDLDVAFHTAVSQATKNPIIEFVMMAIHLTRPAVNTIVIDTVSRDIVLNQHQMIADAIADQDASRAVAALVKHVKYNASVQDEALKQRDVEDLPLSIFPLEGK
ncbi:FadR/GntR family transcriptional regulator [Leucobacter sp. GX24907]